MGASPGCSDMELPPRRRRARTAIDVAILLLVHLVSPADVGAQGADVPTIDEALEMQPDLLDLPQRKSLLRYRALSPEIADLLQGGTAGRPKEQLPKSALEPISVTLSSPSPAQAKALAQEVEALGGSVAARYGRTLYAALTPEALAALDRTELLEQANLQDVAVPAVFVGEGVEATAAHLLHRRGLTGKGVKVGIIDFGFARYDELLARGEVPKAKFKLFGERRSNDVHGTACAEIIHEMAPEAELYLAEFDGRPSGLIVAAKWLLRQDVDIISYSGGSFLNARNGRTDQDQLVEDLRKKGVLFVVAAGNSGANHWMGELVDRDRNGLVDVPGSKIGDVIPFFVRRKGEVKIGVVWEDWDPDPSAPAPKTDVDLIVFKAEADKLVPVTHANRSTLGRGWPVERLKYEAPEKGLYAAALVARTLGGPGKVRVFIDGAGAPQLSSARGSIFIPATSPGALAVGAVDVRSGELANYSSQGPTDDGRTKPDVVAPAANHSLAYGKGDTPDRYHGTSAACPHVSGFAALLHQQYPGIGVDQLFEKTVRSVRAMGRSSPNNAFGWGHIDGTKVAPPETPPAPPTVDRPPTSSPDPKERPEGQTGGDWEILESILDDEEGTRE